MNFTLKLSLSEIVKNKSKVLIAIIVTLILFMSAFTLCNIATALPVNFYKYYEEFMPETIGIDILNADEKLYNSREEYFSSFEGKFDVACRNYTMSFNGETQLSYEDTYNSAGEVVRRDYYSNTLLSSKKHLQNVYSPFFDQSMGGSGSVWADTFDENGIWLADFAAQNIGVVVGDTLQYNFTSEGNVTTIELKVNGIFNSKKLHDELKETDRVANIPKPICFINEVSAREILFESESTFSAYGVVDKIDNLFDIFNELHSKNYNVKEGDAFKLIARVKNTQIICMIVGVIMLICGIIIMLNFINMIISQNIKHISLLRILGTSTFRVMMAYYIIFMLLITVVCLISWVTLPLYNTIVSIYCANLGYAFGISINYWVVLGVFGFCYLITTLLMLFKWLIMDKTSPIKNIAEED